MEYSNPELPEGINASQEHPLKEFFWLTAAVSLAIVLITVTAVFLADRISGFIPFSIEQKYAAKYLDKEVVSPEMDRYLNDLAARLTAAAPLPDTLSVTVHYLDDNTVNAFATLGGHIYIFRGLLERVKNENTLAMVLAHEIAHVRNRDPVHGAGRALVLGLALSTLSGSLGDAVLDRFITQGTSLTLMKYSRDQERLADDEALHAIQKLYGHTLGATALFETLEAEHKDIAVMAFIGSHPLTEERLNKARTAAGKSNVGATVTPLPDQFASWLKTKEHAEKP